ncbi:hypothetical protein O0I10_001778 [Lichtheimia ornata]|uniref:Glucose-induced degradation protein 4 homolog n=1 Tax=Lichtheimia ornata TaxID=688661 RepID=A0AAD7V9Y0_9FUNG|nr:uncharacterized protein O0I10_001778 [Lichtheimia ornata]KAJ8662088.1 hypothetical protein O0I10_001778 [Lichtheimia ornata]
MPIPADGNDPFTTTTLQKSLDTCASNEEGNQHMTCHPKCGHHSFIENKDDDDDSFSTSSSSSSSVASSCDSTKDSNAPLKRRHQSTTSLGKRLLNYRRDDDVWVDISNTRLANSRLGSLYAGSKFKGRQQCDTSTYDVSVDILHVDLKESTLTGYLNIKGLTSDCKELTTFFEAEIIGSKYSFLTRKWKAQKSTDLSHWSRFPSFKPYKDVFSDDDFTYRPEDEDFIYMRWKEKFLVPDHRVQNVEGASFAGFYYICYQRSTDQIKGYYFFLHQTQIVSSFQELSLKHVQERSFGHFELR